MGIHSLFPGASKEELDQMRGVYTLFKEQGDAYVSAKVKYMEDRIPYVDVYIWDDRWEKGYLRLVISELFYWTEEEEKNFRRYLCYNTYMLNFEYEILYDSAKKAYPEINLKGYDSHRIEMLAHIYYATHWTYPEEKFYKAGLSILALHLREIQDYNEEGNSPAEILGLPIKLLRSLAYRQGVGLLVTREKREKLLQVYQSYQRIFEIKGKVLSFGQVMFLQDLTEGESLCKDTEFNALFAFLERYGTEWEYKEYKEYLQLREEVRPFFKMPLCSDYADEAPVNEKREMLLQYIQDKEYIDKCFREIHKENAKKYEFGDEKYCLRMPGSLEELLTESITLSNCLWRYVPDLLNKKTTVLFLRKQSAPDIPYAAVEISNEGEIIQARTKCNRLIEETAKDWIWDYAERKGFCCWKMMDDDEEWD